MPAAEAAPAGRWRERAAVARFRAAAAVLPRLPEPVVLRGGAVAADVAWALQGAGVRRLEENLCAVEPDRRARRRLSRAGMRSYARYWADAFRLPAWTPAQLRERTRVEGPGLDDLVAALTGGRGAVAFLGHSGSWDQVGAWAAAEWGHHGGVLTAAERLEPAAVFDVFVALRARLGVTAVAVDPADGLGGGAGGASFAALVRGLRRGAFVPLLADRDLSGGGVDVVLLGRPSRAAAGPAALSLATGAPLFPVTVHYEPADRADDRADGRRAGRRAGRSWTAVAVVHHRAVPPPRGEGRLARRQQVAAMTQACVDVLAGGVRAHPEDWHALQRVFA